MPLLSKLRSRSLMHEIEPSWAADRYTPSGQRPSIRELEQASSRRICASADCTKAWRSPLRSRHRPIFEGDWTCSGRCMLSSVRAAMGRQSGEEHGSVSSSTHQHRVPLGLLMLAQGWITHPQLRRALQAQRESGSERIGHWLIHEAGVDPTQITRALAVQWGCPVLTTDGFAPDTMALVAPKILVEKFGLVPLRVAGARILYLGFADKPDASAALALESMTGLKVESGVVHGPDLYSVRERLLACDQAEVKMESPDHRDALCARITAILEQKQPIASRLVRIHGDYWLRLWLENGAFGRAGTLPASAEDVRDYVFNLRASARRNV